MNVFSITAVKIGLKQDGEGKLNSEIENKCSFLYERKMTFQKRYGVAKLAIGKNKDFFCILLFAKNNFSCEKKRKCSCAKLIYL